MVTITKDDRIFSGFGSVAVTDRQGDFIPIHEFANVMKVLVERGAPVIDSHSNHSVGKIIAYDFKKDKDGKDGLYLTAQIYRNYPSDDEVWQAIKEGRYTGFSLGGKAGSKTPVCDENGCYNLLKDIEAWEFSIVETPANQNALIDSVNKLAKSHHVYKSYPITKYVSQCGDKWCVYSESGKRLGTHGSKEDAYKQLYVIEVNKSFSILSNHDIQVLRYFENGPITTGEIESSGMISSLKSLISLGLVEQNNKTYSLTSKGEKYIDNIYKTKVYVKNPAIIKAKVYIKNPNEAPQGAKIGRGDRGGLYYESSARTTFVPDKEEPSYEELKQQVKAINSNNGIYDIDTFNIDGTVIQIPSKDVPNGAVQKIKACADSFRFSSLKKKPTIIFKGKSAHHPFTWEDRNGQKYVSEYGGDATYDENVIHIWDDFNVDTIVYHEVGHFVYKQLFEQPLTIDGKIFQIEDGLKGFEHLRDINKYNKMVEILRNHNVTIDNPTLTAILDDINYARNLGIVEDMHDNGLWYYDEGYNTLYALRERTKLGYAPELNPQEIKQWSKYRKQLKEERKRDKLKNEWYKIWEEEGYPQNEYANRNNNETFAEFYQSMDRWLRSYENFNQHRNLYPNTSIVPKDVFNHAKKIHPKKLEFFRKYVMKKYIPKDI